MKIKDVVKFQNTTYRIIDISDKKAFVVDCNKKSVPKWIDLEMLSSSSLCPEELGVLSDINDLDAVSRKTAYIKFKRCSCR